MKMCKKYCFFNEKWLPMALPRDPPCAPSRAPFWLSVALWGLGGSPGPTVGLSDCIFGLGRCVGASADAARTISGSLLRGRTPVGVRRFLNSLTQKCNFKFRFPYFVFHLHLQYVKRHGRRKFPEVVSSCYRAGLLGVGNAHTVWGQSRSPLEEGEVTCSLQNFFTLNF